MSLIEEFQINYQNDVSYNDYISKIVDDSSDQQFFNFVNDNSYSDISNLVQNELEFKSDFLRRLKNNLKNYSDLSGYTSVLKDIFDDKIVKQEKINENLNNKKRHHEINTYYHKKYKHHVEILKDYILQFVILMFICLLYKLNLINETIFISLTGVGIACIIIYTFYISYDTLFRDNTKYDENIHYFNKANIEGGDEDTNLPLHLQKDILDGTCTGAADCEEPDTECVDNLCVLKTDTETETTDCNN